jgi:hypothetical protein
MAIGINLRWSCETGDLSHIKPRIPNQRNQNVLRTFAPRMGRLGSPAFEFSEARLIGKISISLVTIH